MGSATVCFSPVSGTTSTFEMVPKCFLTWRKTSLECNSKRSIFLAPLPPLRTGTYGLAPPPEREQQASWPQDAGLDANEDTFSFYGRSMNSPEWTQGVVQLACKCFHSTKNCSGIVFTRLMPSNHVKGKSASTSYENNLTRFYPLAHSCSNDSMIAGGLSVLLLLVLTLFCVV